MPDFYLFAGVNGAGKSTLYSNELLEDNKLSQSYRINADEIARAHNWDWRKPGTDIKAMKIELLEIKASINDGKSFNLETTLSGSSKYFSNLIENAKNNGFTVHLYYIGVSSVYTALDRIKSRVEKGGHGVDTSLVFKRYPTSLKNLYKLINEFDEVKIYDNSSKFFRIYWKDKTTILDKSSNMPDWFKPAINE